MSPRVEAEQVTRAHAKPLLLSDKENGRRAPLFSTDEELATQLLQQTIAYVLKHSSYYRSIITIDLREFTLDSFSRLPFLTEAIFDERVCDIRCLTGSLDYLTLTGGTSRFQKIGFRTQAEFNAYAAAFGTQPSRSEGLTIELISSVHGTRPFIPRASHILRVPLAHREHYGLIESLLTRRAPRAAGMEPITAIAGTLTRLKHLTSYLVENGNDVASFGLKRLISYGWLLTSRWRSIFTSTWQCPVVDVYGLSEFDLATSQECATCGFYHFFPAAYPEVVQMDTYRPVDPGSVGVLVLTSLYPFWQIEPRIRFWTGDIVEVGPRCALAGTTGIRFKGRLEHSVYDTQSHEFTLLSAEVAHVVDAYPEVARKDRLHYDAGGQGDECGFLRFSVTELHQPEGGICLGIELRFDPRGFPEHTERLRQQITAELSSSNPALARRIALDPRSFAVEFYRPGGLQGRWIIC